jgi:O-acetyl-ADP-ribose deacetylase (regulator of RNase III)
MKSCIEIKKMGITQLKVDAIVNAANSQLLEGGGVCGAIFSEAGSMELADACSKIGSCKTGNAVITPGFNLSAKYIIHAVGPVWQGGDNAEAELLYSAYMQSLMLAKENDCHSIAFPLISAGIYGYPKNQAWKIAIRACNDFINENPDFEINIFFAVLSDENRKMGEKAIDEICIF